MFGRARDAVNGGDVADRPAAVLEHVLHDGLRQEELGPGVDVVHRVELLGRYLKEGLVERDAGVVHQAINTAQECDSLLAESRRFFHLGEVGFEGLGPPAQRTDLVHGGLGALDIVRVMQGHVGTPTGKLKGNLLPDPGSRTSDEHTFAEHL